MTTTQPAVSLVLKDILVATDFSPGTEIALKYAQAIARREASRVYAIHVNGPDSYHLLNPEAVAVTFEKIDENPGEITRVLESLLEGLPNEVPIHGGGIWQVINDVVLRNRIDLLVLATHGRKGFLRVMEGSVAEELFRNVACPVLTVGPGVRDFKSASFNLEKILLATDFDLYSAAPLYASWLANEFCAQLVLLHVIKDEKQAGGVKWAAARLQSIAAEETDLWCKPDVVVVKGDPATRILDAARETKADLIVLGARHPEPARIISHWPWDTAAKVIAGAPCPVLTARGSEV